MFGLRLDLLLYDVEVYRAGAGDRREPGGGERRGGQAIVGGRAVRRGVAINHRRGDRSDTE